MLARRSNKAIEWGVPQKAHVFDRAVVRTDAGTSGTWDAGVASTTSLNGPCYLEFRCLLGPATGIQIVGISNDDPDYNFDKIDFAFEPYGPDGLIYILENGAFKGTNFGSWTSSTVFRIEARSGQVLYFADGVLLYTSLNTPTFPLHVDMSINSVGSTVGDIVFAPIP